MATVIVFNMMPGIPTYTTRFLFYEVVVVPFLPIAKYVSTFENESSKKVAFCYFFFYLIFNFLFIRWLKKNGQQWCLEAYKSLKIDQITFPFILVLLVNASVHFVLFYFRAFCWVSVLVPQC